jgi:hypothetical protein
MTVAPEPFRLADVLATTPAAPWQPKPHNWRRRYSTAPACRELGALYGSDVERQEAAYRAWIAERRGP